MKRNHTTEDKKENDMISTNWNQWENSGRKVNCHLGACRPSEALKFI